MGKTLHLKGSGKLLLNMSDAQHHDLVRLLQEESTTDRDYYIDDTVVGFLEEKGCDAHLVKVLRQALENKATPYRDPAAAEPAVDVAAGPFGLRDQGPEAIKSDDEGDGIDVEWRDSGEDA
jgi:hypothetical protein